jgi:hypothetical protein
MRYRKLRIAWSVACGVACVLLIALCAQSYWWWAGVKHFGGTSIIGITSQHGIVAIGKGQSNLNLGWTIDSEPIQNMAPFASRTFDLVRSPLGFAVYVPYWFLILITAGIGLVPWLPWRYSLGTLLLATTLVAVTLGLIVAVL